MKVKKILEKKESAAYKINVNATVFETTQELKNKKVGFLFVMNDEDRLEGIISGRDLLYKCHKLDYEDPKKTKIEEIFTHKSKIIVGTLEDTTTYLVKVMLEKNIRHIPILDGEKIIGVVSIGDVLRALLEDSEKEIKMLKEFIQSPTGIPVI